MKRALTVVACTGVLVVGIDYVSMATTGQSLLLGKTNTANVVTKISNTGAGSALSLTVKSAATAPFTTNGKGKVANLYADRAASADKLGGSTLAQVRSGIDAATLEGNTAADVSNLGMTWGRVNGANNTFSGPGDVTVSHAGTGLYCILVTGISSSGGRITATPDYATDDTQVGTATTQTYVEVDSRGTDCSAGEFEIVAFNSTPASPFNGTEQTTYFADTGFVFTVVGIPTTSSAPALKASATSKPLKSSPSAHLSAK